MCGCRSACMVAPRGSTWLLWGACVIACGGGTCMVSPRGACMVASRGGGSMHGIQRDMEIRSMSGWYASHPTGMHSCGTSLCYSPRTKTSLVEIRHDYIYVS